MSRVSIWDKEDTTPMQPGDIYTDGEQYLLICHLHDTKENVAFDLDDGHRYVTELSDDKLQEHLLYWNYRRINAAIIIDAKRNPELARDEEEG